MAKQHNLPWELETNQQWWNLDKVREQMFSIFDWLGVDEREHIKQEWECFCANDNNPHIDWRVMAEHKEPTDILSGRKIMERINEN